MDIPETDYSEDFPMYCADVDEDGETLDAVGCYVSELICSLEWNATNPKNDNILMLAARFFLDLKEKFKLLQVSLDFVIHSVEELLRVSVTDIKKQILETLDQEGVEVTAVSLDQVFPSLDPFSCLKTEYQ